MSAKAGWLMNDLFGDLFDGDVIVASLKKMGYNLTSIKKGGNKHAFTKKRRLYN
jgi:hypothetical protein